MSNIEYKPAEKLEVQLSRPDSRLPWGFRLQGGIDFSTPLSIQSVNPNSVSEQCGLKAGDAILAINHRNSDAMAHDDAKEEIQRSGNHITMLIQRGAVKIWKPQVTPLSELRPQELRTITSATGEDVTPVQKTSLAINKPPDAPCTIGSSHNRSAQPFGKPKAAVPNVVHAQYNSPMGLYSANNIADSFAKQTAGIQSQMQNMDVNDAPVGTVISGTGQVLEQEVSVADPSGIETSTTSPTQSAGMNPTTSTTSLLSQTPSKTYRSVSPFQPVAATTTPTAATTQAAGMSPTTSASSMFSQTPTKAYRPVSPFQPVSTSTTTTAATTESAGMSPTTTTTSMFSQTPSKGYRSVSPFQPVSATTTTTAAVTQPAGMSPTTSAPSMFSQAPTKAYRSVSPFQPVSTATSAAAAAPTHPAPYNASADDEEETPGPIMQSRSFQKVQQELEAQDEAESNNNSVNIRGFKSVSAPVAKPPSEKPQQPSMRCGGCDMLATGVIVKASGVPYHVACFKCTSCSMNLKQKGFFVVEGKLYCETHAKRHAKPPGPDMVAVATYR